MPTSSPAKDHKAALLETRVRTYGGCVDIFVDENIRVLRGEDARRALADTNDAAYYDPGYGIPRVPMDRWRTAQVCESHHWFHYEARVADDRNFAHQRAFDDYSLLKHQQFAHAIEVGCGPFTNLRLIARVAHIRRCTLLDPCLERYLSHRNRYYDRSRLYTPPSRAWLPRVWRLAPNTMRAICPLVRWTVPVSSLISEDAESLALGEQADLVVMINVLEHCRDAGAALDAVRRSIRAGARSSSQM